MIKIRHLKTLTATIMLSTLCATAALGESRYGYKGDASAQVDATAQVNISVNVPKLLLLKVGSANTTVDTVHLTVAATGYSSDTSAGGATVNWDGSAAPSFTTTSTDNGLAMASWTNSSGGSKLTCATSSFTSGFTANDVTVSTTSNKHPAGATIAVACDGSVNVPFTRNTLVQDTYTYNLANASSLPAGSHSGTITYTAVTL